MRKKVSERTISAFINLAERVIESQKIELLDEWPSYGLDEEILEEICFSVSDALDLRGNIIPMGSALYGFSLSPTKLFLEFDLDESDIDLATTNQDLFFRLWLSLQQSRQ